MGARAGYGSSLITRDPRSSGLYSECHYTSANHGGVQGSRTRSPVAAATGSGD